MSTQQEYWDACLIKTWRNAGTVLDAMSMFRSITGLHIADCQLRRVPRPGFPWRTQVRAFVASHLSKISNRLWDQSPDKDVLLLRKLATSKYDTEKDGELSDPEYRKAQAELRNDLERIKLDGDIRMNRNHDTDWNVTKGSVRSKRLR